MSRWNWAAFRGDAECLSWSRRDLENLEATLRVVTDRAVAVQAGGNVGLFPKRLAEDFTAVYTFEPDAKLFAALCHNAPEANIYKMQAALGYARGPVSLECSRRDGSSKPAHAGLTHIAGRGDYPMLHVDDLSLPTCGLLYLDVEGYELFALRGASKTLTRCRPVVAVEVNKQIEFSGASAVELREFLASHGYRHYMTARSDEVYVPT